MTAWYAENSMGSTKIAIINDFRNRGRYKFNIQNSTVFPYTSNTQFQMKLKKKQKVYKNKPNKDVQVYYTTKCYCKKFQKT